MQKRRKKGQWYSMLETSKSKTVLIRDASLPAAEPGKIYFYNTDKETIVEYVLSIAESKLRDLTDSELKEAKRKFDTQWLSSKAEFLKIRGAPSSRPKPSADNSVNEMIVGVDDSFVADDDDFEDF